MENEVTLLNLAKAYFDKYAIALRMEGKPVESDNDSISTKSINRTQLWTYYIAAALINLVMINLYAWYESPIFFFFVALVSLTLVFIDNTRIMNNVSVTQRNVMNFLENERYSFSVKLILIIVNAIVVFGLPSLFRNTGTVTPKVYIFDLIGIGFLIAIWYNYTFNYYRCQHIIEEAQRIGQKGEEEYKTLKANQKKITTQMEVELTKIKKEKAKREEIKKAQKENQSIRENAQEKALRTSITAARQRKGLSISQLAERCGMSDQELSDIESGKTFICKDDLDKINRGLKD